jgi:hypothetical protein
MRILIFLASLAIVQSTMAESTSLTPVRAIDQMPEALRLIRTADQVTFFRSALSERPSRLAGSLPEATTSMSELSTQTPVASSGVCSAMTAAGAIASITPSESAPNRNTSASSFRKEKTSWYCSVYCGGIPKAHSMRSESPGALKRKVPTNWTSGRSDMRGRSEDSNET